MYRRSYPSRIRRTCSVYYYCCYCSFALWSRTTTGAFVPLQQQRHYHHHPYSSSSFLFLDNNNNNNSNRRICYSSTLRVLVFTHNKKDTNDNKSFRLLSSSSSRRLMSSSSNQQEPETAAARTVVVDVAANLQDVRNRIQQACVQRDNDNNKNESLFSVNMPVRLVAVSKTKPIELLQAAYHAGCRVFGENYAQELVAKVPQLQKLASSSQDPIQWHYIGALQSNKVNMLLKPFLTNDTDGSSSSVSIDQLTIETVASIKLATKLNHAIENHVATNKASASSSPPKLRVFVQVNTSGEDSKSGVQPGEECTALCVHIAQSCPYLHLCGLMTIGAPGDTACFDVLRQCRAQVMQAIPDPLELSMGMSDDFEQAILAGATNVRVGSTIFGARDYSNQK